MWCHSQLRRRVAAVGAVSGVLRREVPRVTTAASTHDYQARDAREKEEEKLLEEEEFNTQDDAHAGVGGGEDDAFLPLSHRLAAKADVLDAEMDRLAWSLYVRRQLVADTAGATWTGRPTRVDKVLDQLVQQQQQQAQQTPDGDPAAGTAQSPSRARAAAWSTLSTSPCTHWKGSSSPVVQLYSRLWGPLAKQRKRPSDSVAGTKDLTTLSADLDYLRRGRQLHRLHYYHRLNLIPKRHVWHALFHVIWNFWVGARNAACVLVFATFRGVRDASVKKGLSPAVAWCIGAPQGLLCGLRLALKYLWYGWVFSPLLHLSRGLWNTCYGPISFFTGKYLFDSLSGRWMRCAANDAKLFAHELQLEKRLIRTIGRATYNRAKSHRESKWSGRLAAMGFSMEGLQQKIQSKTRSGKAQQAHHKKEEARRRGAMGGDDVPDPYEVLGVRRTANQQHIKEQYKKLAKVFHPDVAASQNGGPLSAEEREKMQAKFAAISNAYQVLSNAEKKKAYDAGGAQGLHMHETKYGTFLSRTPEEMVQSIFGGEGFRRLLIGELLRSHWDLKNEAQVSVSLQDFEELQCIRTRQLSAVLADILDVHAQKPTTGPYYRHSVDGAGARGGSGVVTHARQVRMSGLPDPFGGHGRGTGARGGRGRAGSTGRVGGRGAVLGGHADLHEAVLSELGEGAAASSSAAARTRSSVPISAAGTSAEALARAAAAAEAAALSPYTLHPGTNEFNSFSRAFEERCVLFVSKLSEACFGPELLYEVGEAYVIGAQRFLGVRPFYAPKLLVQRKVVSGIGRVWQAFVAQMKSPDGVNGDTATDELARKVMLEYFNLEFDNIVADMHVALRYTVQNVLQDVTESEDVRKKRCYALWFLGEKMKEKGRPWSNQRAKDDAELIAYIQQAANSASTTSRAISF